MAEKRIAMLTGSFDPVTAGHMDLIKRAAKLFDTVYVAVLVNGAKGGLFTPEQRLSILKAALVDLKNEGVTNVVAESFSGLASEYAAKRGARYIVRGARSAADFDYEAGLAAIMKRFDASLETVILPAAPEIACISASYVRELLKYGCPLGDAVSPEAGKEVLRILAEK